MTSPFVRRALSAMLLALALWAVPAAARASGTRAQDAAATPTPTRDGGGDGGGGGGFVFDPGKFTEALWRGIVDGMERSTFSAGLARTVNGTAGELAVDISESSLETAQQMGMDEGLPPELTYAQPDVVRWQRGFQAIALAVLQIPLVLALGKVGWSGFLRWCYADALATLFKVFCFGVVVLMAPSIVAGASDALRPLVDGARGQGDPIPGLQALKTAAQMGTAGLSSLGYACAGWVYFNEQRALLLGVQLVAATAPLGLALLAAKETAGPGRIWLVMAGVVCLSQLCQRLMLAFASSTMARTLQQNPPPTVEAGVVFTLTQSTAALLAANLIPPAILAAGAVVLLAQAHIRLNGGGGSREGREGRDGQHGRDGRGGRDGRDGRMPDPALA